MKTPDPDYPETMTAHELASKLLAGPDHLVYMSVPTELNMAFNVRSIQPDKLSDGTTETPVVVLCFDL